MSSPVHWKLRATFLGRTLNKAALRYTTSSSTFAAWTKLAADLATNGLHARRSLLPFCRRAIERWSGGAPVGRPRRWTPACPIPSKPSRHAFPGGKSSRGRGVGTAGLGTTYGTAGGRVEERRISRPADHGSYVPPRARSSSRPVRWIARDAPAGLPPAVRVTSHSHVLTVRDTPTPLALAAWPSPACRSSTCSLHAAAVLCCGCARGPAGTGLAPALAGGDDLRLTPRLSPTPPPAPCSAARSLRAVRPRMPGWLHSTGRPSRPSGR
jgi:hypothetical protein